MLLPLFLLQVAATDPAIGAKPDIELNLRAHARSIEIQQKGEATLQVSADPDAGSKVETRVTPKANGRSKLRNVDVTVHGEARIGEGVKVDAQAAAESPPAETSAPETPQPD
jgi:hypothetical protein